METIYIGGVPEHFNLAWYLCLKEKAFNELGIHLRWKDFGGGTGAMNKALRSGEIDLAVILTEGVVRDIIQGNPSKIVQTFVKTPLLWGIHVAKDSKYKNIEDLKGKKAAISRYGSGSHLMSYIHAEKLGWDLEKDLQFQVVKNLEGAIPALQEGNADYFMWEKFTTKPLVDNHTFRCIDTCPTPWPCFVIAARQEFINKKAKKLKSILSIINAKTKDFKSIPQIENQIAKRYGQKLEDVKLWLSLTEWSQNLPKKAVLQAVQNKLLALDLIDQKFDYEDLTYKAL